MTNNNVSKKQKVIFPENTVTIIKELLKKYGFRETIEEVSEKIEKGEKPIGTILAETIREATEKEAGVEELSSLLQTRLNLSSREAQKLARDIKIEIIGLIKAQERERSAIREVKEKKPPAQKDIYREPIE